MISKRWAVTALRVFLVALFGILVVLETLSIPGSYAYMAQQNPEEAYLRWPSTIVSVFWVVCVQVVIVATWKLLTLVRKDLIFTDAAIRWVNVMVWAIAAAWVVLVGVFLWVGFNADDPGRSEERRVGRERIYRCMRNTHGTKFGIFSWLLISDNGMHV